MSTKPKNALIKEDVFRINRSSINHSNEMIRAVNNPIRQKILNLLSEGIHVVEELCGECELEQAVVSHHLSVLRKANLVDSLRSGKHVHYSLNKRNFDTIIDLIKKIAAA